MIVSSTMEYIDVGVCRMYPGKIFVFGDNGVRKGKGGQAVIRGEVNAFGVATKRYPSMDDGAYFRDGVERDRILLSEDLIELWKLGMEGRELVFPSGGLGTGLARMSETAPELFREMNRFLVQELMVMGYERWV